MRTDWIVRDLGVVAHDAEGAGLVPARDVVAARGSRRAGCAAHTTSTSGTLSRIACDVGVVELDRAPGGHARGTACCVRCVQTKKLLVAPSEKPRLTPFRRPLPEPSITMSMKMPQKTPKAVSAVRSLLRSSAS